ncbi:DUF523 domain-containing protein [Marinobacterium sp. YM272]|uniref:DUF523 domain-containing protein n=1 Tax=Marinobacterium sp. YM272 TaxID=3421654 RepID=UPI003D7FA3ED
MEKILVSACLLGSQVRYDGNHNLIEHPVISRWKQEGRLIAVCPEVLGGLPTPRSPAEVQSRFPLLVTDRDGEDRTPQFLAGAELASDIAREHNCCCALMKARSPSCGNRSTYNGRFSGELVNLPGVTANELIREGRPVFNEEEIDQLIQFVESRDLPREAENSTRYATTCG